MRHVWSRYLTPPLRYTTRLQAQPLHHYIIGDKYAAVMLCTHHYYAASCNFLLYGSSGYTTELH